MKHRKKDKPKTHTSNLKPSNYYFQHEPLRDALLFIQDMLERSSLPFILLGNTAKQMLDEDPMLYDYKITIGIKRRDLHPDGLNMLKELVVTMSEQDGKMFYLHQNGVPVYISILEDATYFDNPDTRFYYLTELKIPNPFITYWEARGKND